MEELPAHDVDLARWLRPGDRIVCGQGTAEPRTLTEALVAQRAGLGRTHVFLGTMFSATFAPEHRDHIAFSSWCGIGTNLRLARAGALDVIVASYSQWPALFASGAVRCDAVLLQVSAPDAKGRHSVGTVCDYTLDAARRARTVIAEVNDRVPWTHDGGALADVPIHAFVRSSREIVELPSEPPDQVASRIAAHAAEYVEDGVTLESGIGAIADAVLRALRTRRDLGLHSGLVTDAAVDLVECGALTNARKEIDAGCAVTGGLFGTGSLRRFAERNPAVRLASPRYTHDAAVLARLRRFVAINGAIEVDLTGQVNAESALGAYAGAVGGHSDFVRAALRSPGGRSIVVLPATVADGSRSRIVAALDSGVVTTTRGDADIVVTEYGAAELRGQPLSERVRRMAAIAAPAFRDGLLRDARGRAAAG